MKRTVLIVVVGLFLLLGVGNTANASLMGWWKFDETSGTTAVDSSASGYDGTLSSTGASFVTFGGASGGYINLTKSSGGYVTMGNVLDLHAGSYTISAWVKTEVSDVGMVAVSRHHVGSATGYILGVNKLSYTYGANTKAWSYNAGLGADAPTPISLTTVTDGAWHFVVSVRDMPANKAYLYVDGGPREDSKTDSNLLDPAVAFFLIGGMTEPNGSTIGPYFTGGIDDVQVYNTALSEDQINYLYAQAGSAVPIPPSVWLLGSGLIGLVGLRRKFFRK